MGNAAAEVNAAAEASAVSNQLSHETQAIAAARVAQQAAIADSNDAEAKMKAAAALKVATDQICKDLQNMNHVFMFNPSEHDQRQNVVFNVNDPTQVQGSIRVNPENPAWIRAIPGIPLECNEQEKFMVQWDVSLPASSDFEFCMGVISDMDKKWYFTNTKSYNDRLVSELFVNFFNSGDVVRVSLERVRQTNQCTLTATNLTMNKRDPNTAFKHMLEFTCPDLLCPVVCISNASQIYKMQSVATTEANSDYDTWRKDTSQYPTPVLVLPDLTWTDLNWWSQTLKKIKNKITGSGGKSKMTRKRQLRLKKGCNTTYRKFKRANMKTTRMRKKFHAHKKIRMTLKNKNK